MSGLQTLQTLAYTEFIVEGFLFGKIVYSGIVSPPLSFLKLSQNYTPGLGIYSAMFAMYLQYEGSKKPTDKRTTIVFYSLCTLYALSSAVFTIDIAETVLLVSKISVRDHNLFSCYQSSGYTSAVFYKSAIISSTMISGCCDFLAQSILVRVSLTSSSLILFIWIFKDLPLLDCVEL